MTDIASIMSARNAILQGNAALRGAAGGAPAATVQGTQFAAALSKAQSARPAISSPPAWNGGEGPAAASGDFGTTLSNLFSKVNASQEEEDRVTEAYERGDTNDLVGVMLTQQKASLQFEATVQIRNKLLSAYRDIMNMPV